MPNLVSIIMPAYNAEKTISQSIESVIAQTYSNWELIIVNDNSNDQTSAIIKFFSDNDIRIKSYINEGNYGPAYSRDLAISKCRGQYICFLDSDDLYYPNKIESQLYFMTSKNYLISYHYYDIVDSYGKQIKIENNSVSILNYHNNHFERGLGYCLTFMIQKSICHKIHFMDCNIKVAEDYSYFANLLRSNTAFLYPSLLGSYRKSENSRSSNKIKAAYNILKVYIKEEKNPIFLSLFYCLMYVYKSLKRTLS